MVYARACERESRAWVGGREHACMWFVGVGVFYRYINWEEKGGEGRCRKVVELKVSNAAYKSEVHMVRGWGCSSKEGEGREIRQSTHLRKIHPPVGPEGPD